MRGLTWPRRRRLRKLLAPAAAIGMLSFAVAAAAPASAQNAAPAQPAATAPDAPGTMSYYDLARKDCVGTARNTSSKV